MSDTEFLAKLHCIRLAMEVNIRLKAVFGDISLDFFLALAVLFS